eukprot:TRINITY_DN18_c0_g2_i1.p1 TRINITY_DN18_c0_g2~~TRINITY_DN18_c0_g2_i1.p1  ORF type:complete len:320 (+),score=49.30 TRINITY_DN18_c0_g2_i1:67-960(+)
MHNKMVVSSPHVHDEDASMLCALFPQLDMNDAYSVLRRQGSIEKAANVLVDVEVIDEVVEEEEGLWDDCRRELPNFLRCPKCYSSDILLEDETSTVVCIKCHHHFTESMAKKGAVRAIGSGKTSVPKKSVKKPSKKMKEIKLEPTSPVETDVTGPIMQKLQDTRAAKAANPTLRLVVSHAGKPKEKKVITIPLVDGYTSLMKQARAKFRLRKPLKGLRILPEGVAVSPLEIVKLQNGQEVLVTFQSELSKTPTTPEGSVWFPDSDVHGVGTCEVVPEELEVPTNVESPEEVRVSTSD